MKSTAFFAVDRSSPSAVPSCAHGYPRRAGRGRSPPCSRALAGGRPRENDARGFPNPTRPAAGPRRRTRLSIPGVDELVVVKPPRVGLSVPFGEVDDAHAPFTRQSSPVAAGLRDGMRHTGQIEQSLLDQEGDQAGVRSKGDQRRRALQIRSPKAQHQLPLRVIRAFRGGATAVVSAWARLAEGVDVERVLRWARFEHCCAAHVDGQVDQEVARRQKLCQFAAMVVGGSVTGL